MVEKALYTVGLLQISRSASPSFGSGHWISAVTIGADSRQTIDAQTDRGLNATSIASLGGMSFVALAPAPYIVGLTGAGLLIALVAWLPTALKRLPLSLPIICIGLGAALFSIPAVTLNPLPMDYQRVTERFTEFVVIIALMGAGLKIDRVFKFRHWAVTWRLLAITMPLSIAAIALLGAWGGLPWVAAILLGASLAPTALCWRRTFRSGRRRPARRTRSASA